MGTSTPRRVWNVPKNPQKSLIGVSLWPLGRNRSKTMQNHQFVRGSKKSDRCCHKSCNKLKISPFWPFLGPQELASSRENAARDGVRGLVVVQAKIPAHTPEIWAEEVAPGTPWAARLSFTGLPKCGGVSLGASGWFPSPLPCTLDHPEAEMCPDRPKSVPIGSR